VEVHGIVSELSKAPLCAGLEAKMHFLRYNPIPVFCKIFYIGVKIALSVTFKSSNKFGFSLGVYLT